jgi:hypothetical protein
MKLWLVFWSAQMIGFEGASSFSQLGISSSTISVTEFQQLNPQFSTRLHFLILVGCQSFLHQVGNQSLWI